MSRTSYQEDVEVVIVNDFLPKSDELLGILGGRFSSKIYQKFEYFWEFLDESKEKITVLRMCPNEASVFLDEIEFSPDMIITENKKNKWLFEIGDESIPIEH